MSAALEVEANVDLGPTPNFSLNRVGSHFPEQSSPSAADSTFFSLGSIGRLCNEVDDITLAEKSSSRTAPGSLSPEFGPLTRVPTGFQRDSPVFSWESRSIEDDGASLDALLRKRQNPGSSLAPQSNSDLSDAESEAPSVGQFRPGTDLLQCPVAGCERTFKWKKNLHHHIRDKHPANVHGISAIRMQPAYVGASHNGTRLGGITIAPQTQAAGLMQGEDVSLRCSDCGKAFARKGDLVHHKRYHTRSTDRPYKCEQCGQGFIHHKDLARHMPRHTGQRSFQCPFQDCNKNYTRKDNLNRHMRHDHGGVGVSGEVWTGVEQNATPEFIQEPQADLFIPEPPEPLIQDLQAESSSDTSNGPQHINSFRETTPSLGKRPADDLDRIGSGAKPKRKPKEKWAHRLGCPFRKCRRDAFTTENGFRVCETTPHEFIIRLIEHMKRNHDLYVCGECFLGFDSPDSLNNHKATTEHCGKCYLSFGNEQALVEHSRSCMTVDASTQEDIWQILYETLCADGVRHNPSFDDDAPIEQHIESNNRVRMHFVAQQPLSQGQVPSLSKRMASTPGNGPAPPVYRAEENRQQLVPVGATSLQVAWADMPSETQQLRLQVQLQQEMITMLDSRLMAEVQARMFAQNRADRLARARVQQLFTSAVRRLISSIRRPRASPIFPRYDGGMVEELPAFFGDTFEGGPVITLTAAPPATSSSFKQSTALGYSAEIETMPYSMQVLPQTQNCPSMTSESTLQTQEEAIAPQAVAVPAPGLDNISKDSDQNHFFCWGDWSKCQNCGNEVAGFSIFCDSCTSN